MVVETQASFPRTFLALTAVVGIVAYTLKVVAMPDNLWGMEEKKSDGPPTCGDWCGDVADKAGTKCMIDTDVVPCAGDYYCTSTCDLWEISVLKPESRPVTCASFKLTQAYPVGGELCKEECLLPELGPERYPAPTGVGFFCAPGTCDPAVQLRYKGTSKAEDERLGIIECPCNWFGTDCPDEMIELKEVLSKEVLGNFVLLTFKVTPNEWEKMMADYKPGGVVRLQHYSPNTWRDRPLEQPATIANDKTGTVGHIELLLGPPEHGLESSVTEVNKRVRALEVGPVGSEWAGKDYGKLYINPAVASFYSKPYYTDLLPALKQEPSIKSVVLLSTGAGISGVRMTPSQLYKAGVTNVHLIYGIRDVRNLAYRQDLIRLVEEKGLKLTIVVSSNDDEARTAPEPAIAAAIAKGDELKKLKKASGVPSGLKPLLPKTFKLYAQHALGLSFAVGDLAKEGATLENTAIVVCARPEVLFEIDPVLQALPGAETYVPSHLFLNI